MKKNKPSLNQVTTGQMLGLMLLAYLFSFAIRMIWVYQFQDNPSFMWNEQLMINTNDGYFFAAGAQETLSGLHVDNPRVFGIWDYGLIFFTTLFAKITPFSLETVILYMSAVISSLVVVPMILIARIYKQTLWGFFSALLGSIAWSYYNRTMTGYYDTDMFSAMAPMLILFFLLKSTIDFNLRSAFYAGIAIIVYPFLYDQGQSIVYAMGIIYAFYMVWYHRHSVVTYSSLVLVFISLLPFNHFVDKPYNYLIHILILVAAYWFLKKEKLKQKELMILSGVMAVLFLLLGNVLGLIVGKMLSYTITGTDQDGLHFYAVNQTVREAGKIPFFPIPGQSCISERMSGSAIGFILSIIGYIVLLIHKKEFILALPLIGIGVFAHWGGLRFTVYAVPIAAMSSVYLFFVLGDYFKDKKLKYGFIVMAVAMMLYPNITHIIGYKVPTVLNKAEVQDLVKLDKVADAKDYTLTWWDYGYPVWYYSDTSTLIDGGKHNNDNFIISKIMQTTSPELAVNLSRLAVETYVEGTDSFKKYIEDEKEENIPEKFKMINSDGKVYHAGSAPVANTIFRNKQTDQKDPNFILAQLESDSYALPKKTREIYIYMPYRMMNIYPTVAIFGNLDLESGEKEHSIVFYPSRAISQKSGIIRLANGMIFDTQKGTVNIGGKEKEIQYFITTANKNTKGVIVNKHMYHSDGEFIMIFLKSYGQFVFMDKQTYHSMYVQMFMLEHYDKNLFELVVSSPYSKIYKLKK